MSFAVALMHWLLTNAERDFLGSKQELHGKECASRGCLLHCFSDTAKARAGMLLGAFAHPSVFLLLGCFILSTALHKYGLDKVMAEWLLWKASSSERGMSAAIMLSCFVLSMVVSNVAAAVLLLFLVSPVVSAMPRSSNLPRAALLSVALSANIGGMATPVSSPQNVQALSVLSDLRGCDIGFLQWMGCALPICVISLVCGWLFISFVYLPSSGKPVPYSLSGGPSLSSLTWRHWCVNPPFLLGFGFVLCGL